MEWLSKRGRGVTPKTRSIANRVRKKALLWCSLLVIWALPAIACSRSVASPNPVTATKWAVQLTAVAPITTELPVEGVQNELADLPTPPPTQVSSLAPTPTMTLLPTPTSMAEVPPSGEQSGIGGGAEQTTQVILYTSQAGDTLPILAVRFNVDPHEITSPETIPENGLITPGQLILIPARLTETGPSGLIMPDSEVVYSPSTVDFDIDEFVRSAGGYLFTYRQELATGMHTGAQVVERVAKENSINPRLLLSILEFQSKWVFGQPDTLAKTDYPLGHFDFNDKGLYKQLNWAVQQLSIGYYGWRGGWITELEFSDQSLRLSPELNAGTVAVQYLFSKLYPAREWGGILYSPGGFPDLHTEMFGSPWIQAQNVEPLYPTNLTQPRLVLPFPIGHKWAFTGGPHSAWGPDGARAALDFAPGTAERGCAISNDWVVASASGLVVRSENGLVVIDLDGDGFEQTGWVLLYLHIRTESRIPVGTVVDVNDRLGHPSCEGGIATGTHVHIVRKYNGEWILADGPVPFNLDGWIAHAGSQPYLGTLTKEDRVVTANVYGSFETQLIRESVSVEP